MIRATLKEDLHFLGGVFLGAPLAALIMFWTNCSPPKPSDVPPAEVTEAQGNCVAFRLQKQLECVTDHRSKEEIDACRAGVQNALDCTDGGWIRFTIREAGAQ
jgi:hypothetical protein